MDIKIKTYKILLASILLLLSPLTLHAFGDGMGMKGKRMGEGGGGMGGKNPEVMGAFIPMRANLDAMEKRGFVATGLQAVYPENFDCPKVGSPFASPYRTDGSKRAARFFEGLHGGMDIAQPKGTPLLAMADGEVIAKHGEGDGIGGLGIWIRHSPEQTGTGKWVFLDYKHIDQMPELEVGDQVKKGQVIAHTGNTGTDKGGYYGYQGFYHLHMTAHWSDSPDFKNRRALIPIGGQWLDPIALFKGSTLDSKVLRELPDNEKSVKINFMSTDGSITPADAKVIWPYACPPRQK